MNTFLSTQKSRVLLALVLGLLGGVAVITAYSMAPGSKSVLGSYTAVVLIQAFTIAYASRDFRQSYLLGLLAFYTSTIVCYVWLDTQVSSPIPILGHLWRLAVLGLVGLCAVLVATLLPAGLGRLTRAAGQ